MRKRIVIPAAIAAAVAVPGVAFGIVGTPNVANANAGLRLTPVAAFKATDCTGVSGVPYVTYRGAWKGTETDVTPGSTPYNLSGPVKVAGVVWTINLKTQRGVLRGTVTLSGPTATGALSTTYSGNLVVVTQGVPTAAGNGAGARGWINAATVTAGAADGGSLLANTEFRIFPGLTASGTFGDMAGTMSTPNYSVTFNNMTCS